MSFLVINKTLKPRTATNAKISVLVTCIEAIIYLLLYTLHDCPFKNKIFTQFQNFKHVKNVQTFNGMTWRKRDLNVNEEILKSFKKLATSFCNFINHLFLILFHFYSPFFHLPLLYYLPLNGDSFVTVLRVMTHFGSWFQQFFLHILVHIYIYFFFNCSS